MYERQIRDKVELKHKGKFLVIDIETGKYEIDDDDLAATKRLLQASQRRHLWRSDRISNRL